MSEHGKKHRPVYNNLKQKIAQDWLNSINETIKIKTEHPSSNCSSTPLPKEIKSSLDFDATSEPEDLDITNFDLSQYVSKTSSNKRPRVELNGSFENVTHYEVI